VYPSTILNLYISPKEFKEVVNIALRNLSNGQTYNKVIVLGLT